MLCKITDLRDKDVINIKDGCRIGCVSDVEVDTCCGRVMSIVIYGHRLFGFFGACNDIIIRWEDIQLIGDDTILVCYEEPPRFNEPPPRRQGFWKRFWG